MDRKWTYQNDSGAEFGPYTREELLMYSEQGRISRSGRIREDGGEWIPAAELLPTPRETGYAHADHEPEMMPPPPTPPITQGTAESINTNSRQTNRSIHPRILYILLGIILPLTVCGLAGVNNLWVGRTAIGGVQLGLSLFAIVLNLTGIILGITFCIGVPLWAGIVLWSILEAATNEYDGEGRLMR
jgi:hypothetical protein